MTAHDGTAPLGTGRRELALAALSAARADDDVHDLPALLQRICRAAEECLSLVGASVHLLNRTEGGGVAASSNDVARLAGEAAFAVGEGPSLDALRPGASGLRVVPPRGRTAAGRPTSTRSGCQGSGPASRCPCTWARSVSECSICTPRPRPPAPRPGLPGPDLRRPRDREPAQPAPGPSAAEVNARLVEALERRGEIHQAQGMVMVDLGVDLAEALTLLRAHAFSRGLSLLDVAREIVAGGRLPVTGGPRRRRGRP